MLVWFKKWKLWIKIQYKKEWNQIKLKIMYKKIEKIFVYEILDRKCASFLEREWETLFEKIVFLPWKNKKFL